MSFLTAEQARTVTQPTKFGTRDIVFTGGRVSTLQSMISAGLPASMADKWAGILTVDNTYTPQGPLDPWYFPGHYVDDAANDEVVAFVRADVEKAVDLAIRWKVAGDPDDAAAVVRILTPWTTIQTITDDGESRLNWSNKWPMFLQAAMLVRDSDAYTEEFDTAMRA
ncbi:hypothetical protein, partial [Microbacterium sp. KR10-403]|uniref:hypothetical protein n=1 Tax=Microbacterium sp. KR10-403 TaxID=3158581 RepID=UPI0032E4B721